MIDMSKISALITGTKTKIAAMDEAKKAQVNRSVPTSLTPSELFAMQELKSLAQASGKITLGVALWIYNTVGHWGTSSVADRYICLEVIAALSGRR